MRHRTRHLRRAAACGALVLTGAVALVAPSAGAQPRAVEVIIQVERGAAMDDARRAVERHGGRVTGELRLIGALSARIPAGSAAALHRTAAVAAVTPNARVRSNSIDIKKLSTAFPRSVAATTTWKDYAVTGKGVGVAVIDTGIAGDLPDFRVDPSKTSPSRVIASAVLHPDATTPTDRFGHGTHVAGIIAGNATSRPSTDPLYGKHIGVAPNANLISVKVSDDNGAATVIDVIRGLQFVVDHKDTYNIRVVNLSLESSQPQSYRTDPLAAAVEAAWFKGLVVVAAAGNRGTAGDAVTRAPGNDPFIISVGAVDDQSTQPASDDAMATWSSRGTTQDGIKKPEIYAAGSKIVSALAPNSKFSSLCPSCVVDGQYIRAGGTSMSAPMVSGTVALLLEKYPKLTPDQVKGVLLSSTRSLAGGIPAIDGLAAQGKASDRNLPVANQGLVPNDFIDRTTYEIDYTRSSWSRSSWSTASDGLTAGWARSSWSCSCLSGNEDVVTSRSSWSRSSWSTAWGL